MSVWPSIFARFQAGSPGLTSKAELKKSVRRDRTKRVRLPDPLKYKLFRCKFEFVMQTRFSSRYGTNFYVSWTNFQWIRSKRSKPPARRSTSACVKLPSSAFLAICALQVTSFAPRCSRNLVMRAKRHRATWMCSEIGTKSEENSASSILTPVHTFLRSMRWTFWPRSLVATCRFNFTIALSAISFTYCLESLLN